MHRISSNVVDCFLGSAGAILICTGAAKIFSSVGSAPILEQKDPILGMPYRSVFLFAGIIETLIGFVAIYGKDVRARLSYVTWLATAFALYRVGLVVIHHDSPCPCLGSLTDTLHIDSQSANRIMSILFLYLLLCSYGSMLWMWRQKVKRVSQTS